VEIFAVDRVLLLPAGIGTRPPATLLDGRVTRAACYGQLVTLDPTGVVLVRPGARLTLGALFRSWGQPLSPARLASFSPPAGTRVTIFVDGRPWPGALAAVPLTRHAEIVLEVGPHVPRTGPTPSRPAPDFWCRSANRRSAATCASAGRLTLAGI